MKRSYLLVFFVIGGLGAFAACGGDDGTVSGDVDAGNEASVVDNFVPPADTGVDTGIDTGIDTGLADVLEGGTTLDGGSCGGAAVTVTAISPQFAWTAGTTPITITGTGFIATPKVYLRGTTGDAAGTLTQVQHVAFVSSTSITVVIPKDLVPPGDYQLAVVNGNTCAGVDTMGIRIVADAPPQVLTVTPAQATTSDDVTVTITGCGFASNATVSTVSSTGTVTVMPAPTSIDCSGGTVSCGTLCTMQATIQAKTKTLAAGPYLVRVTNPTPQTFGEYASFIVTNPSGNPGAWVAATNNLNTGRRALGLVAGRVNDATRFLYAIGGETAAGAPLESIEVGPLDRFGNLGKWFVNKNQLVAPRSGLAVARYKQWIYALGGTSTSAATTTKGAEPTGTPLASIERAKILDPAFAPVVTDPPAVATGGGTLAAGTWYYKVSAINTDADDPGGESIASDEVVATLSAAGKVTLSWTITTNGATPTGFKIYRSMTADATSDSEVLVATVTDGSATSFEDTGFAPDGGANAEKPMPAGSTGQWVKTDDAIGARLNFPAVVAPTPSGDHYLYMSGGWGNCNGVTAAAATVGCVESAKIDETTFGIGAFTDTGKTLINARQRHAMAVMTKDDGPSAFQDGGAPSTAAWIFVGGGRNLSGSFSGSSHNIEHAMVDDGGTFQTSFTDPGGLSDGDGMQIQIANGYAYAFQGGSVNGQNGNVVYSSSTHQSPLAIVGSTTVTLGTTWPSAGAALPTKVGRHGVVEESAFFYAVGGTSDDTNALASVYRILH